jgi:tRNA nucleotidyltransferase (CCA-adding enzyme)
MQVYLVGGAVRDSLLGLPVKERDWVVIGATREELLRANYREVGREFPVFLHPQTHEEYALARLERKVAPGYRGFTVEFGPEVTLEEDLGRRDLTINAIARAADGTLLDPYGGRRDLEARLLRHVSPAFAEDPVTGAAGGAFRGALRAARVSSRRETAELMRAMVSAARSMPGRRASLAGNRQGAARAGAGEFFRVLRSCGALRSIYPEIDALFGVPQPRSGIRRSTPACTP